MKLKAYIELVRKVLKDVGTKGRIQLNVNLNAKGDVVNSSPSAAIVTMVLEVTPPEVPAPAVEQPAAA